MARGVIGNKNPMSQHINILIYYKGIYLPQMSCGLICIVYIYVQSSSEKCEGGVSQYLALRLALRSTELWSKFP
jgi:hypothetical protein